MSTTDGSATIAGSDYTAVKSVHNAVTLDLNAEPGFSAVWTVA